MPELLALIADEDTVLGFGALGMECRVAESRDEALAAMLEINKGSFATVFITDEVADFLKEEMPALMKKFLVMKMPSCRSRNKMGLEELSAIVERAVGIANIMDKA